VILGSSNVGDVIIIVGGMLSGWACAGEGIGVCAAWLEPSSECLDEGCLSWSGCAGLVWVGGDRWGGLDCAVIRVG